MTEHYTYRVRWSAEDGEYVATVAELPSLSWLSPSPEQAFAGLRTLVADVVTDMERSGEEPPTPLAERSYSGRFVVRVPSELHRELVLSAAEQNVSLNHLATQRLARG